MLRLIHKLLFFDAAPSKRAQNDSWLLRVRWIMYVKHIQRMASFYAKYAISDIIEHSHVIVLHERRDEGFENELRVCGLLLRNYLHEKVRIVQPKQIRVMKRSPFFSYFAWTDTITIETNNISNHSVQQHNENVSSPARTSHRPKQSTNAGTLLGKEHVPAPPPAQTKPDQPIVPPKTIKKKKFEIDSTF